MLCDQPTDSEHVVAPLHVCSSVPAVPPAVNSSHSAAHEGPPAPPRAFGGSSPVLALPSHMQQRILHC